MLKQTVKSTITCFILVSKYYLRKDGKGDG